MLPVAIIAGGLGTRLYPVTAVLPKALVPICGEPFIAHQLRQLSSSGITRAVLCVGFLGESIQSVVGDGKTFGLDVEYSWDGPAPLGTAGAIVCALPKLGPSFFTIYGDSYLTCDFQAVEDAFSMSGKSALMTVFRNEGRWDSSNVEFAHGRLLAYDKRSHTDRMHHIDYGLSVFHRSAFECITQFPADLADVHQSLLTSGELIGLEVTQRFYEVGSFEGINSMSEYVRSRNRVDPKEKHGIC